MTYSVYKYKKLRLQFTNIFISSGEAHKSLNDMDNV